MAIHTTVNETASNGVSSRLTGAYRSFSDTNAAESGPISELAWDYMEGYRNGAGSNANEFSWMWRRAPGFMDVVAYEGNGGWTTVNHNLAVEPEMIISKSRSGVDNWWVWVPSTGSGQMFLNTDGALPQVNGYMRNATNESFEIIPSHTENIAYLFASVPGISKVGSYTGTGLQRDIDCGFTTGARFVLIKRTDGSGHWFLWDVERGLSSLGPNTKAIYLNSTVPEQPARWVYARTEGFGLIATNSYVTEVNVAGQEYIYYAIA